jgi:hypothetical protein
MYYVYHHGSFYSSKILKIEKEIPVMEHPFNYTTKRIGYLINYGPFPSLNDAKVFKYRNWIKELRFQIEHTGYSIETFDVRYSNLDIKSNLGMIKKCKQKLQKLEKNNPEAFL